MKRKPFPFSTASVLKYAGVWPKVLCSLLIAMAAAPLSAQDSDDLLEPERAFAFSAGVISPEEKWLPPSTDGSRDCAGDCRPLAHDQIPPLMDESRERETDPCMPVDERTV